jgi:hypothetical protein
MEHFWALCISLPARHCLHYRASVKWSATSKRYNDYSWIFKRIGNSVCWSYEGDSICMTMMVVHFVKFPVGGPATAPPTPFRFIVQHHSALHLSQKFLPPLHPPYACSHPTPGISGSFRLFYRRMRNNFSVHLNFLDFRKAMNFRFKNNGSCEVWGSHSGDYEA